MSFGVDYAQVASAAAIRAFVDHDVKFACRYYSRSSWKNLTPAEARALAAAGLWIVTVWETAADRALAGHAAGADDAAEALAQAKACGQPSDRPIYFAVDFDASAGQQAAINTYLDGCASVLGRQRVGIYGGYGPVSRAMQGGHAEWGWQTYAWSGGRWYGPAELQQYSNDHVIGGIGLDYDRSTADDFGQWKPGVSPNVHPAPDPTPTTEDDMPSGQLADGQDAITPIALPRGRYKTIGFTCDNGLQGLPPAKLRVAVHRKAGWHTEHVTVDSAQGQTVVTFDDPATTDGISVQRSDAGTGHIGYEVS